MPRRVNAALAACLVGVSEKAMGSWLQRYGAQWGATKREAGLGRPAEWEIGMVELHTALAHRVNEERINAMIEWIDLHRGTGGGAFGAPPPSGPVSPGSSSESAEDGSPVSTSSRPSRTSWLSTQHVPGRFQNRGAAINFLVRHGVNARTARDWRDDWAALGEFTPENVLRMAGAIHTRQDWRARWRLVECNDPGCVCHSVL